MKLHSYVHIILYQVLFDILEITGILNRYTKFINNFNNEKGSKQSVKISWVVYLYGLQGWKDDGLIMISDFLKE